MPIIVITGCSTGIGLETAHYLKERFVTVYPTARYIKDVNRLKAMGFEKYPAAGCHQAQSDR